MNALLRRVALAATLLLGASLSGCQAECHCPAAYVDLTLSVEAPDGGPLSGVMANFTGPSSASMSCETASTGNVVICRWPGMPLTAGKYAMQVSATGYERSDFDATLTVTEPLPGCSGCCCETASLSPSTVTLAP